MNRKYKIILGVLVLLLGLLVYMEASAPKPVNWLPSYSKTDKIPLGTYVFYHTLKEKSGNLEAIDKVPYEFLQDSVAPGTYFFVNSFLMFDKSEFNELLAFAAKGNDVFLSAHNFSPYVLDTLHLEEQSAVRMKSLSTQPLYDFVNPALKSDSAYHYAHEQELIYLNKIDTLNQTVLGVVDSYKNSAEIKSPKVNFIDAPVGKGHIFVHTSPEVFGNYFMLLKDNHKYLEKLLSYINLKQKVYWDDYYKVSKPINTSPLYLLLSNPHLKWAYYFVIFGALFFVYFEGKRKQKSIPIVKPLKNQTYDYTRTIAGMYLDKNQHLAMAHKQINYFLFFIRNQLRTPVENLDEELVQRLAAKTNNTEEKIRELFSYIEPIRKQKLELSKQKLIKLDQLITDFKNNC